MKLLFTILLAIITVQLSAQDYSKRLDSLEIELKKQKEKTNDIYLRLDSQYKQYSAGTIFIVTGIIASGISTIFVLQPNRTIESKNNFIKYGFPLSGALTFMGWMFQVNSHKYFFRDYEFQKTYTRPQIDNDDNKWESERIKNEKKEGQ